MSAMRRDASDEPTPLLPVLVHAVAAALFVFPLALASIATIAALGGAAGALVGPAVARTRVRSFVLPFVGLAGLGLARVLEKLVTDYGTVPEALGPENAVVLGDALVFGLGAFVVVATLRALTTRRRVFAVLEVLGVAFAAASLVAGHRNGAINRPFELADPILATGGDPVILFLAIGGAASVLVALLLLRERSLGRTVLHVVAALALLSLLLLVARRGGLPTPPPPAGGVGLRPEQGQGGGGGGRGQGRGQGNDRRNTEDLDFRDDSSSRGSPAPIAVVIFHDEYVPPAGVYYFRQGAFSHYNGRKLVSGFGPGIDEDVSGGFPVGPVDVPEAPPASPARRELSTTVALLADHTRPFGLESPVRLRPAPNPDPARFRRTYEVTSRSLVSDLPDLLGQPPGNPAWDSETWQAYTELPSDPRYAELAHRIVDEMLPPELAEEPIARVAAVVSWLGREGIYSLRSRHSDAPDPAGHFLFGDKTGYCVHFAHAGVYLMRSLGLPARVATGYAVDAASRQGGSALVLTDRMAHAWPEVYFQGYGWVVADVYPQRSLDPSEEPVDRDLQRLLGEFARGENPVPPDAPGLVRPDLARLLRAFLAAARTTLGIALPLLLLLLYVVKLARRVAPRLANAHAYPRLRYRADLDRLSELGLRRARGESREAFARRVLAVAPSFADVTAVHVGAAFGSRVAPTRVEALRSNARTLPNELAAAKPLWRRLLGLANPFSFLLSR
ncbi:MAG: transglutaminase domain-containing protein [Polyangiales bacterium]